jgi:hypothetical protein
MVSSDSVGVMIPFFSIELIQLLIATLFSSMF